MDEVVSPQSHIARKKMSGGGGGGEGANSCTSDDIACKELVT